MKSSFKSLLFTFLALLAVPQTTFAQEPSDNKHRALKYVHYFADSLVQKLAQINQYTSYEIKGILIQDTHLYEDRNKLIAYVEIQWSPYSHYRENERVHTIVGGLKIFIESEEYEYYGKCESFHGNVLAQGKANTQTEVELLVQEVAPPAIGNNIHSAPNIPQFPWPPPKASAREDLPNGFFNTCQHLAAVDSVLTKALKKSGYREFSYFAVPDGFALVTRIEQINKDASPKDDPIRWSLASSSPSKFSLRDYIAALFTAPKGYFRVISFIITDQTFAQSAESVTRYDAIHWLNKGVNRLPKSFKDIPFTEDYCCTALIYEFTTLGNSDPIFADPSQHQGYMHLGQSMLWTNLQNAEN